MRQRAGARHITDKSAGAAAALRAVAGAFDVTGRAVAASAWCGHKGRPRAEAVATGGRPRRAVGLALVADGEHATRVAVVAAELRAHICPCTQSGSGRG